MHRWDVGPVPLPGRALELRHVHARLLVPALDRRQVHHRWRLHPEIPPRDRARARHRSQDPLQPPRQARVMVVKGGALDGRSGARPVSGARPLDLQLSASSAAATTAMRKGYTPDFPGIARFKGRIVHPQGWTDDVDYANKRVVMIGSGATAVTLAPELAKTAVHVTMLQRSPTYVVAWPDEDCDRQRSAPLAAGQGGLRHHALEKCARRHVLLFASASAIPSVPRP